MESKIVVINFNLLSYLQSLYKWHHVPIELFFLHQYALAQKNFVMVEFRMQLLNRFPLPVL